MSGRAGRAGIDACGESVLLVQPGFNEARLSALLKDQPAPITSCLIDTRRGMKRAMLEVCLQGGAGAELLEKHVLCSAHVYAIHLFINLSGHHPCLLPYLLFLGVT